MLKRIVFFTSLLLGTWAMAEPKINETAPDFTLPGHDGKNYKLSDFKGKYVVLEWWNKDCPFVVKYYKPGRMQALQKEIREKGGEWFTVLSSAPGKQGHLDAAGVKDVMKTVKGQPTAVLMDPDGKVGRMYAAKTTPHMYVINPEGKLIYKGAIDDKPTANVDDLKGATNYVTLALNQARAGKKVDPNSTRAYGCSIKY